jgi:hypothetical protein
VGGALQAFHRQFSFEFGSFDHDDPRLLHAKPPRELLRRHSQSFANRTNPALGRPVGYLGKGLQPAKSPIKLFDSNIHQ